jgi:hypothetical protein
MFVSLCLEPDQESSRWRELDAEKIGGQNFF